MHLSRQILLFATVPTVLILGVGPASKYVAAGQSTLKTGEMLGLFVPLVTLPLYWLLFKVGRNESPPRFQQIIFLVLAALWAEGYSISLTANAVGLRLQDVHAPGVHAFTHFCDEVLSHYLWHFAMIGLSTLLLCRQWQHPLNHKPSQLKIEGTAGAIYGAFFFGTVVEGGTVVIGLPFAALVTLFGLIWGRQRLRHQPLLAFSFVAYAFALILFAGWLIYWGEFTEPTKAGLLASLTDY